MALSLARSVLIGSGVLAMGFATAAEVPGQQSQALPVDAVDMSLSRECRVPGSKLYTLAPLIAVRAALEPEATGKSTGARAFVRGRLRPRIKFGLLPLQKFLS